MMNLLREWHRYERVVPKGILKLVSGPRIRRRHQRQLWRTNQFA